MAQIRAAKANKFRRDAWLEINVANLEHNLKQIHQSVQKPLIPVLKADAYGHGAVVLSKILSAYDFVYGFAVASIDEALSLREVSPRTNIMILGISPEWSMEAAVSHDIELTLVNYESALKLNEIAKNNKTKAKVHIKLDTGMNRIGFRAADTESSINEIHKIEKLNHLEIKSLFSHFASPSDRKFSEMQIALFDAVTKDFNCPRHMASSQIARELPSSRYDMVRCGIELYGLHSQSAGIKDTQVNLRPLMSLFARINFIKTILQGESVSYGQSWTALTDTQIATLPLGYADGLNRHLSNKIYGYCKNNKIKQVGLITMDQVMFDIGNGNNIKIGDAVELLGEHLPIDQWCRELDTISYEIIVSFNMRLPRVYTR
jgi:alanine racemase